MKELHPLEFLAALRKSDRYLVHIYTQGSCYKLYEFLKKLYPEAKAYLTACRLHVVTKIDGRFYDIEGEVEGEEGADFFRMTADDHIESKQWEFFNNHCLNHKKCEYCGENTSYNPYLENASKKREVHRFLRFAREIDKKWATEFERWVEEFYEQEMA